MHYHLLDLCLIFLILRLVLPCPLGRRSVASGHRERHACQHQGFDPHATYFVQPFSCHNSVLSVYEKPLRLQRYYKYLEYTRILRKKLNLFKVFEEKTWIFAQLCDRSFGGSPLAGGPKILQIFLLFFRILPLWACPSLLQQSSDCFFFARIRILLYFCVCTGVSRND